MLKIVKNSFEIIRTGQHTNFSSCATVSYVALKNQPQQRFVKNIEFHYPQNQLC